MKKFSFPKMASVFTQIIQRKIPSYIIAEQKDYIAFLDINPIAKGHTLVVPKQKTDYIFDLDDKILAGLFIFSKKIALGIQKIIPCLRVGMAVVGLEVPHAHIHLIPLNSLYDIDFKQPKLSFTQKEFTQTAAQISEAIHKA